MGSTSREKGELRGYGYVPVKDSDSNQRRLSKDEGPGEGRYCGQNRHGNHSIHRTCIVCYTTGMVSILIVTDLRGRKDPTDRSSRP